MPPNPSGNGEFHFTLRQRRDRNGDVYLFAGIPMFNSVLFLRPDPTSNESEPRWLAVLKPYTGPRKDGGERDDDSGGEWR